MVVPLEVFAEVTGRLEVGVPRGEVLAAVGLDEARWEAARDGWLERMAARAAGGDLRMSQRFADLVVQCEARAREERAGKPKPFGGPMPVVPEARLLRIWRAGAGAAEVPSLAVAAQPAPGMQVPIAVQAVQAVPAMQAPVAVQAPPVMQVPVAVQVAPPMQVPAILSLPKANRAPEALTRTGPLVRVPAKPALPFAAAAPVPEQRPRQGEEARPGGLPFRAPSASPPASPPAAPLPAPSGASAAAAGSVDGAWKALEDYARLCARVRAAPARVPELMAEMGVDAGGWQRMHAEWSRRFAENPSLRSYWQRMVEAQAPGGGPRG